MVYVNYIYRNQDSILYQSREDQVNNNLPYETPDQLTNGLEYLTVTLNTTDNVTIKGWFMYQKDWPLKHETPTIIYMHEGDGGLSTRIPFYNFIVHQLHLNVLSVAHRGYHDSEGHAHEIGMKKDADAILEFISEVGDTEDDGSDNAHVLQMINENKVYLFGKGTGGAVAMYMA